MIFGAAEAMTSVCIHSLSASRGAPAAARRSAAASAGEARNARSSLRSSFSSFSDNAPAEFARICPLALDSRANKRRHKKGATRVTATPLRGGVMGTHPLSFIRQTQ